MSYDAWKLTYDGFELFGQEVLFTGARVDRETLHPPKQKEAER